MSSLAHSVNSNDRLGVTLLIAILFHSLVILGISFDIDLPKQQTSEKTLDIIVVRNPLKTSKPDKEADFLAQASQQGGGQLEKKQRLTSKPSQPTQSPAPVKRKQSQPAPARPRQPARKVLVTKKAAKSSPPAEKRIPEKKQPKKFSMNQLLASAQQEIDLLTAEIDRKEQLQSKSTRRKFINSNTQEYKYAAYLSAWRKKVEDIGNLNYPDEAKRKKIYGTILMTVVLKPDGQVASITIKKSSGQKILDDAARRIVNLAAPFAPFPKAIRKETDELVITRTWQFLSGDRLFSE